MLDIQISGVCERDIDLLLLEELSSSREFLDWFILQIEDSRIVEKLKSVKRSVTTTSGESDIEISFIDDQGRTAIILVENKVDANFQKDQVERYGDRGMGYVQSGKCDYFFTVLTAPLGYMNDPQTDSFDTKIAFENIIHWYSGYKKIEDQRLTYKTRLLEYACGKFKKTSQMDPANTSFWLKYYELHNSYDPTLKMKEPGARKAGGYFVYFYPTILHSLDKISFIHKYAKGDMDLQIDGIGDMLYEFENLITEFLEEGMTLLKRGKSAAICIKVPELDPGMHFDSQKEKIKSCFNACRRLVNWVEKTYDKWGGSLDSLREKDNGV